MAYLTQVGTTITSNTNLNTAGGTLVHTQTNTTRIRKLLINVFVDQIKGNGDYVAHITVQRAGAGSAYKSITTTKTAASGETAIVFSSIELSLNATDVLKVYVTGLSTDSDGTADVIVDVNEEWISVDASGNVGTLSDANITALLNVSVPRILDTVEFQRKQHTVVGAIFYVDGVSGNDTTGTGTRALPWKTISKALTACTDSAHDEIILLANPGGGPTLIADSNTIVVAKKYVAIRGPGRDVLVKPTAGPNKDVFSITESGVSLSGFRIETNGNASNGVTISNGADFVRLDSLWITASQDGVHLNVANNNEVLDCIIVGSGRDGVRVSSGSGSGTYNVVAGCVIRNSVGSAVNLLGSDASDCLVRRNVIRDNGGGVTIAAGAEDTVVTDNRFINNVVTLSDAGTRTLYEWNHLSTDLLGIAKANLVQILGTALTETAGQIAAAFKKFFDKSSPTGTINSMPDAVAGAPNGLAIVGSEMTPTAGDIDTQLSGTHGAGTWALADAAADPLLNPVPGDYESGTGGWALGQIVTGDITVLTPMTTDGQRITLVRGDDYLDDDGRALIWSDQGSNWPDLTAAMVMFKFGHFEKECEIVNAGGTNQQVKIELTTDETGRMKSGRFDLEAVLSNLSVVTLIVAGRVTIISDVRG